MFNEDLLVARKCDVTCWLYVAREGPTVGARVVVSGIKNKALVMLLILALSGDIELNPGPTQNNIASPQSLSLYYANLRSIADAKLQEFNAFFSDNSEYDVICVTETWLHSGVHSGELLDEDRKSVV